MELTEKQKLVLLMTVLAASVNIEGVSIDIKPSEASKLQTKILEFVEEHGEKQAETLMEESLNEAVRALYNDVIGAD